MGSGIVGRTRREYGRRWGPPRRVLPLSWLTRPKGVAAVHGFPRESVSVISPPSEGRPKPHAVGSCR